MTFSEKLGLLSLIAFFTTDFPASWKGAEIILFILGAYLLFFEEFFNEWLKDFLKIN